MRTLAKTLLASMALLQLNFCILEMFLWKTPLGLQIFHTTRAFAEQSRALAANQGLYNAFLAAGLLWGLCRNNREFALFFLACMIVAGAFGALTVNFTVLFVQAMPAAIALAAVLRSPAQPQK